MSNQQLFPQTSYPGNGDIQTTPGSPNTTVVGIQTTPVLAQPPQNGQILIFSAPINAYVPGDPIVSGPDAPGNPPSAANPVQIGGIDDGNLVREVRTDTYGAIQLSMIDRSFLQGILNQLKAITRALINFDQTAQDSDYVADNFDNTDPMQ